MRESSDHKVAKRGVTEIYRQVSVLSVLKSQSNEERRLGGLLQGA